MQKLTAIILPLLLAACGDNIKPDGDDLLNPGEGNVCCIKPTDEDGLEEEDLRPDAGRPTSGGNTDAGTCEDGEDTGCHWHNNHWHCDKGGHEHNGKWHQGHL